MEGAGCADFFGDGVLNCGCAGMVDEVGSIHEDEALGCGGVGHAGDGGFAQVGFIDQDVLAGGDGGEGDFFFGHRGRRDINRLDIGSLQEFRDAFDGSCAGSLGHKFLGVFEAAAGDGGEVGVFGFRQSVGDDAGDHAGADDAEAGGGGGHGEFLSCYYAVADQ